MRNYFYNPETKELHSLPEWVICIDRNAIKISFEEFNNIRLSKINKLKDFNP